MQMIHQIWVKWVQEPENPLFIPNHFEWQTNDIEVYENVPIFRVSDEMYNIFLERNHFTVPSIFLKSSLNKSYYVSGESREVVKHCFIIVSPLFHMLAICTKDSERPFLKSKLVYRHETIVKNIIITSSLEETNVEDDFFLSQSPYETDYIFTSSFYAGLNQKEISQKKMLLLTLRQAKMDHKLEALSFFLSECGSFSYSALLSKEIDEVYELLLKELRNGWSPIHQVILEYTDKWLH